MSGNRHERGENNSNQLFHHPNRCGLRLAPHFHVIPTLLMLLNCHSLFGWCVGVVVVTCTGGLLAFTPNRMHHVAARLGEQHTFCGKPRAARKAHRRAAMLPKTTLLFLSCDFFSHPTLLPASTHHPHFLVV